MKSGQTINPFCCRLRNNYPQPGHDLDSCIRIDYRASHQITVSVRTLIIFAKGGHT